MNSNSVNNTDYTGYMTYPSANPNFVWDFSFNYASDNQGWFSSSGSSSSGAKSVDIANRQEKRIPCIDTYTPSTSITITEQELRDSTCYPKINTFEKQNNVKITELDNGLEINTTMYAKFKGAQKEWVDLQKYMQQAADELGLTLVYGDVTRTVAASNAGREQKGDIVAKGGESPHNYGVAADIVLFSKKDGKCISKTSVAQEKFAQRVKQLSSGRITWGGDFNKPNEEHHFELTNWREKYKKPEYLVG